MTKTCSIFFYEGWLGVAPTLMNLATSLAKQEYQVTIYTRNVEYAKPESLHSNIKVIYFSQLRIILTVIDALQKIRLGSLIPTIKLALFALQILAYRVKQPFSRVENSISIGIDTNGSILSLFESWLVKTKIVYLSLELSGKKTVFFDRLRMFLECFSFQKSVCVLIQDEDRFQSLCEALRCQHKTVFYLPNSIASINSCLAKPYNDNYFRDLFKLDEINYPYLIVQAGWIDDLTNSKELAAAFNLIDSRFALILHERQSRKLDEPYIKLLREVNSSNLFLSLEPLPYQEIDRVFAATTIGLVFYKGVDENFSQIAKASGKLSGFLKHGKPVLMSNLQSLTQLNERYQFGVVIQNPCDPLEIEEAIKHILINYSSYSQNAVSCYHEEFDFSTQSKPILNFISAL